MSDRPFGEGESSPEEWLRDALKRMLGGDGSFNSEDLARLAGMDMRPEELQALLGQFSTMFQAHPEQAESQARQHALRIAGEGQTEVTPQRARELTERIRLASLWIGEVTAIAPSDLPPLLLRRSDWATATLPVWWEMTAPIAQAISRVVAKLMTDQSLDDETRSILGQAHTFLTGMTETMFRLQLAQVVGTLAKEVLSGGDVGIPLLTAEASADVRAGLVPQNMDAFASGLDIPFDQADTYLAVRELAHQRLFRHAKWLRPHVLSLVSDFARGIHIDTEQIRDLAEGIDPSDPDSITSLLTSGQLLPRRTEEQERALERLETMLALIEGWVDYVTGQATQRLPLRDNLAEAIRRRRATGGPAEQAFKTLVGLELRPRRLREASELWREVTDAVGAEARDDVWTHPDHLPVETDLDDPSAYVLRVSNPDTSAEVEAFLEDLFGTEPPETE